MAAEESGSTSMLSEELREELGIDDENAVVLNKKRKIQGPKEPVISEESLKSAKKMSKQAQKRFQQIELRKAKESKLSTYHKVLSEHQISEAHKSLLLSTRDIGQKHSQKETLKRLLKKYRAGMKLTEAELKELFPYEEDENGIRDEMTDAEIAAGLAQLETIHALGAVSESVPPVPTLNETPLAIDFTSIVGGKSAASATVTNPEKVEKNETVASVSPADSNSAKSKYSFGATLKDQLAKLQPIKSAAAVVTMSDQIEEAKANETQEESPIKPYLPVEIYIPAMTGAESLAQLSTPIIKPTSIRSTGSLRNVPLFRNQSIQEARLCLPVCGMEQEIVEMINENDVVILCGETGSGKSTQVPQFLYEAGYGNLGMIAITQPRRVAATSTACRVAFELGDDSLNLDSESKSKKPKPRTIQPREHITTKAVVEPATSQPQTRLKPLLPTMSSKRKPLRSYKTNVQLKSSENVVNLAQESNPPSVCNGIVGYQVRFDSSTVKPTTRILFMTDGILLREISSDLLLRKYSVVILDEAHERNVNTDILLGMLSRAIPLRRELSDKETSVWNALPEDERSQYEAPIAPLKLIIMSATLRIDDFKNPILFPKSPPPVINVEARQYPVVTHFARKTEVDNYLKETFLKVCQIHRKLPPGGILVFLTGKREILHMCRKLVSTLVDDEASFSSAVRKTHSNSDGVVIDDSGELDDDEIQNEIDANLLGPDKFIIKDEVEAIGASWNPDSDGEDSAGEEEDEFKIPDINETDNQKAATAGLIMPSLKVEPARIEEESTASTIRSKMLAEALGVKHTPLATGKTDETSKEESSQTDKVTADKESLQAKDLRPIILPLYAMMNPVQQARVFQEMPPGTRLIVVATNVAETSITIPGIRYVVDCGRQKVKTLQSSTGICKYEVQWISKNAAEQRKGRAGRTGPGHCYRLYSSAFFDQHMKQHQDPVILSTPLEDLLLQLKAMNINDVESFPFPTSPSLLSLKKAQTMLINLGALKSVTIRSINSLDLLSNLSSYKTILNDTMQSMQADSKATNSKLNNKATQKSASISELVKNVLNAQNVGSIITDLGEYMAKFPVNPRFAKMIILANKIHSEQNDDRILQLTIGLVCCMSEKSPFLRQGGSGAGDELGGSDDSDQYIDDDKDCELWYNQDGDALARLCALGAAAFSLKSSDTGKRGNHKLVPTTAFEKLCFSQSLMQSSMIRSLELCNQLKRVLARVLKSDGSVGEDSWNVDGPPRADEAVKLRQIMMSAYVDCIARRAPLGTVKTGSRRRRLTAYLSCDPSITEPLYIHPHSNLYQKDPSAPHPDFVIFSELVKNTAGDCTYMSCVTPVNGLWVPHLANSSPLLQFSSPLESPSPYYDSNTDCVMCYVVPNFGIHKWEFPAIKKPLASCCETAANSSDVSSKKWTNVAGFRRQDEAYRWFARFILEGQVVKFDSSTYRDIWKKSHLKESPSVITSMKPVAHVSDLLQKLISNEICSLAALKRAIIHEPTFLCNEIEKFFQLDARKVLRRAWASFSV